jgi:hypothetical protein
VVLAFGVLYTGLTIFVLSFVKGPSAGFSIGINATGAWIMNQFFWHKYVGADKVSSETHLGAFDHLHYNNDPISPGNNL